MQRMRFVGYGELDERPNVIVDGSPTESTRLTLSHWPGSPTPVDLLDDLSAQIAFRALERSDHLAGIDAVSNNHFDQDGLASAFALVDPVAALERRDAVIDIARAGDFGTYGERSSIRTAFALAAFADPDRSPLDASVFVGNYDDQCTRLYEELLPRFGELVDHPERTRPLWEREDAHLTESLAAIDTGTVALHEDPQFDLVSVRIPDGFAARATTRFAINRADAVHPAAVNQSSNCTRVATIRSRSYRVELRYETWVMYRSRQTAPRPDLRDLAAELNDVDSAGGWTADHPGSLTPALHNGDRQSSIEPDAFLQRLRQFLASAPAAWDPYRPTP